MTRSKPLFLNTILSIIPYRLLYLKSKSLNGSTEVSKAYPIADSHLILQDTVFRKRFGWSPILVSVHGTTGEKRFSFGTKWHNTAKYCDNFPTKTIFHEQKSLFMVGLVYANIYKSVPSSSKQRSTQSASKAGSEDFKLLSFIPWIWYVIKHCTISYRKVLHRFFTNLPFTFQIWEIALVVKTLFKTSLHEKRFVLLESLHGIFTSSKKRFNFLLPHWLQYNFLTTWTLTFVLKNFWKSICRRVHMLCDEIVLATLFYCIKRSHSLFQTHLHLSNKPSLRKSLSLHEQLKFLTTHWIIYWLDLNFWTLNSLFSVTHKCLLFHLIHIQTCSG